VDIDPYNRVHVGPAVQRASFDNTDAVDPLISDILTAGLDNDHITLASGCPHDLLNHGGRLLVVAE
jgi:hypothetical protein